MLAGCGGPAVSSRFVGYFFLLVAAFAGLGLWRVSKSSGKSLKYLEEAPREPPLQLAHLSGPLARVAEAMTSL